ncbi:hypothetical protein [Ktedonospora formicarum]|uniref:Protein kinase domain-containing protein n=1 Tax=Ktedonospora formicarum TaxID=2778364 RepID=A0A8J3MUD8_9CHLR|nr:hypothetical protein [Ktedonospora formicarum]GHO45305.1 hypothetical protein KSX_34680 [Ktedonospora formicarum]
MSEEMQNGIKEQIISKTSSMVKKVTQELTVVEKALASLTALEHDRPVEVGEVILGGRYRIERHLYSRPRVNLYLGRATEKSDAEPEPPVSRWRFSGLWRSLVRKAEAPDKPLVAIREIILTGMDAHQRTCIETAGVNEFIEPIGLGAASLASEKDRVLVDKGRLYLILQLQSKRDLGRTEPTTLDTLLDGRPWPEWLGIPEALQWGVQLGRMIARLHRMGVVLGEIVPPTLLVDKRGLAPWAPLLLTCWPPAPRFWDVEDEDCALADFQRLFPLARGSRQNAFLAPEMLYGLYDQRTDVYALGALLYLLLTRIAPVSSMRRLQVAHHLFVDDPNEVSLIQKQEPECYEGLELIPPRFWCADISEGLERIVLKALALDPGERYDSVFDLVEALEALSIQKSSPRPRFRRFTWF